MSLTRLPAGGMLCSYNTYTFGPSAETTSFAMRTNLDPSGRTVATTTYAITVKEAVHFDTEAEMGAFTKSAIAKLERNGGELRYSGRGFGDLNINTAAGGKKILDAKWGPITKTIVLQPTGAGLTIELTWSVEFTIICPDEPGEAGTIVQFTYTVSYDVDKEGYTARDYDASVTIAQTKRTVRDKALQTSADVHLETITPALLAGFRRESRPHKLSLDKCTLTLTVRDTQMAPNLPPVNLVDATVENTWQTRENFASWTGTIAGTYTLARRESTALDAILPFMALVEQRAAVAREMVVGEGLGDGFKLGRPDLIRGKKVKLIPLRASASEPNVYGRTQVRLSISYLAAGIGFSEILRSSGLWKPTQRNAPDENWRTWVASIPTVFSPRGHAFLRFDPKEDSIVDACVGTPKPQTMISTTTQKQSEQPITQTSLKQAFLRAFPPPDPQNSWVEYQTAVTISADTGRVVNQTLPQSPLPLVSQGQGGWDVMTGLQTNAPADSSPFAPLAQQLVGAKQSGGEAFVNQRTRPTLYATLSGVALRAGYQIPVPELLDVNGARPVLVGNPWFRTEIVANYGVPVVRAEWNLVYAFVEAAGIPAGSIPPPTNAFLA